MALCYLLSLPVRLGSFEWEEGGLGRSKQLSFAINVSFLIWGSWAKRNKLPDQRREILYVIRHEVVIQEHGRVRDAFILLYTGVESRERINNQNEGAFCYLSGQVHGGVLRCWHNHEEFVILGYI